MTLRKRFGASDLEVSTLGFGCSRIGGMSAAGPRRRDSVRLLHEAVDRGINFFDTADAYADGDSERLLGEAFQRRRDRVVLATKGGYRFSDQPLTAGRLQPMLGALRRVRSKIDEKVTGRGARFSEQDFSPTYVRQAVEASLTRLRTDYIDLYQLHAPKTGPTQLSDTVGELANLQQAGKIRHFGVGLESLDAVDEWLTSPQLGAVQIPFGLLDLEAKAGALGSVGRRGAALIARGAYGGGLLKASLTPEWLRKNSEKWARIARFHAIAKDAGRSIYAMALHYVLQQPEVTVVLLGMHTPTHLTTNLACAGEPPLDAATLAAIDRVNAEVPLSS